MAVVAPRSAATPVAAPALPKIAPAPLPFAIDSLPPVEVDAVPAPGWRSAAAHVIDLLVPLAFGVLVAWIEAWISPGAWRSQGVTLLDTVAEWIHAHAATATHAVIAAVLAGFAYHLLAGRWHGRTLGRRLGGIHLVRKSGGLPRWPLLLARTALSLVSIGCFGAGYFWAIVDGRRRTWHDLLTGTLLVVAIAPSRALYSGIVRRMTNP